MKFQPIAPRPLNKVWSYPLPKLARQSGLALVIVIWILTLLSIMAGSFALSMRRESSVSHALKNNAKALALAEAGLNFAAYKLQLSNPDEAWTADGSIYQLRLATGENRIRIFAETGKVDINTTEEPQLKAIMAALTDNHKEQEQLLDAIIDWRDEDDEPRTSGAEQKQYKQAGLGYQPTNKPFQSLDELQMVLGISAERFNRMLPWITIYSGQSEVDLDMASRELLQILNEGLQERNTHDVYLEKRLAAKNSDHQEEDTDTPDTESADQNQIYTIMVQTLLEDQATAYLEAVVKLQNQDPSESPLQILDWKQTPPSQSLFDATMESLLIPVQDEFTNDD